MAARLLFILHQAQKTPNFCIMTRIRANKPYSTAQLIEHAYLNKMKSSPEKLLKKHEQLTHSEVMTVTSHVQRNEGDWIINTLIVEGCEVPFRYKRTKPYKNLKGRRVNLTYYPITEMVAGIEFDVMNVVRIKISWRLKTPSRTKQAANSVHQ